MVLLILCTGCTNKNSDKRDNDAVYSIDDEVKIGNITIKIKEVELRSLEDWEIYIDEEKDKRHSGYEDYDIESSTSRLLTVKYQFYIKDGIDSVPDNFYKSFLTEDVTGSSLGVQKGKINQHYPVEKTDDIVQIAEYVASDIIDIEGLSAYYFVYESKPDYEQYIFKIPFFLFSETDLIYRPDF